MAKGRIVNTTPTGKHSLQRTRHWVIKPMPATFRVKDPGYVGRTWAWQKGRAVAHGAGSINCESEIRQLLDAGQVEKAVAMYDRHHSIRGVPPIRKLALWRRLHELGVAA
jgi:hypothetical protein